MLVETSRSVQIGVRRETIASSAIRMQRGDSERPTFGNRGRRATVANPGFVGSSPTEPQAATGLQFRLVFRRACVGSPTGQEMPWCQEPQSFDATRPSRGSRARYTSPIPPAPSGTGLHTDRVSCQKRGPSVRAIIFPTKGVAVDRDYSGRIV